MASEEEFTVFQNQLVELGQENFRLKEQLDELTATNADLIALKAELEACERERTDARLRHEANLQVLKQELENIQKQATDQAEASARRVSDRIVEVNGQISDVARETKEKEEQIEQLREQLKTHKVRAQEKAVKLERLERRAKACEPLVAFLNNSRSIPMYIEDLSVKLMVFRERRIKNDAEIAELDQRVTDLHRLKEDLGRQIKEKHEEISDENRILKEATLRISDINRKIESTREALVRATERLALAKGVTERAIAERDMGLDVIRKEREEIDERVRERECQRDKLQCELDGMKSETDKELAKHSTEIQKLRRKLSLIKETGDDDEIPRVDEELKRQIQRVVDEKSALSDRTQMLEQAILLVEEEIREKDLEIQTLTLKMVPTPRILANPEFQQKQLLLEELILQNRELRTTFAEMTERIVELKDENARMKKRITQQRKGE